MTTHTWILVGLAVVLSILVAKSYRQFLLHRMFLRRHLLWPFTAGAVSWVLFSIILFHGMICFLSLAAIVGIYGPSLFWILKPSHGHGD
jgi:hypothetical protein